MANRDFKLKPQFHNDNIKTPQNLNICSKGVPFLFFKDNLTGIQLNGYHVAFFTYSIEDIHARFNILYQQTSADKRLKNK